MLGNIRATAASRFAVKFVVAGEARRSCPAGGSVVLWIFSLEDGVGREDTDRLRRTTMASIRGRLYVLGEILK